ncbi:MULTISPECIES: DUF2141 domain-containing protein [unclassified Aureimonas]|uniref:DUF2141 domain-containing protein n=1 Tax=unclassified Aureimonas TaxID=2615206 RepID=UPI000701A781|nr:MULTISPECIES: DUF2141 domain-containing protein [unclassified Aureimonas]KQT52551.1 hypothetical protein ASG62_15205 [Aureimonas sp. Leaf427]KQT77548.1 hypothetical protein ASG54_11205 [Aureimonas sp. Leaf460]
MLRTSIALAALLASVVPSAAADLSITVEGLRNRTGSLSVCLFRDSAEFPDCGASKSAIRRTVPASAAGQPIRFRDLAPGAYAVTVLHDENSDGKLDTNLLGIPKEGVGITNNRLPRFSAPTFGDARIEMPAGRRQTVTLVYW